MHQWTSLYLSPLTPLDVKFDTPSPSPPYLVIPIPCILLEAHEEEQTLFDQLENPFFLKTEVKCLVLTLCKVGSPLEATFLPLSMSKIVYISPTSLDHDRDRISLS
ncbi:hypothetical protein Tco_0856500 [Tanacetum coccineum]|uniref:Uncharacterized protein n=1 Tax=Tanacetum coccineum TaxID=301880 RepID=A0ABQ5B4L3_9ASTR